jgi:hypothetical protein
MRREHSVDKDELREFLIVLRQGLLLIVSWIEKRYELKRTVIE